MHLFNKSTVRCEIIGDRSYDLCAEDYYSVLKNTSLTSAVPSYSYNTKALH